MPVVVAGSRRPFRVVAGKHDDVESHRLQFFDGGTGKRLDGIGHGDQAHEGLFADEVKHGLAVFSQLFGSLLPWAVGRDVQRGQQPGVPGGIMDVMDVSGNALTGRLGETGDFFKYEVLPFGFSHDRHA